MKPTQILAFVFCLELTSTSSLSVYNRTVNYEKEIVIRCGIQDEGTANLLSNDKVDVWMISRHHADIRLEEQLFNTLRDDLPECSVLHPSVESLVREFELDMVKNRNTPNDWHQSYHRYNETVQWYQDLVVNNPGMATFVESIGKSVEGRDQPAIRITTTDNPDYRFYFQCLTHAREWISGAVCMYIAEFFATGNNEEIENLLSQVELVFVPFVNPDGYEYTWTNDRLWFKNRRNHGYICVGVDIDKNFNDHWAQGGSSNNPCSTAYHGPSAASEPETQNIQNFFKTLKKVVGTMDWHSYGQTVLRPYARTCKDPPDEAVLKRVGDNIAYEIQGHGLNYTSQKANYNFKSTGSALDWFYSVNASCTNDGYRAASFKVVLRDTGKYGYLLPADQIIPTGEENIISTIEFIEDLLENPIKYSTNCV